MSYRISDVVFNILNDELLVNNQLVECKKYTLDTLRMFLDSDNQLVTKDDLLTNVWKDVVVSEASVFKQIQHVKTLFLQAGIAKDAIENVYGKGYKLKYSVEIVEDGSKEGVVKDLTQNSPLPTQFLQSKKMKLFLLVLVSIMLFTASWQYQENRNLNPDFLSKGKRESMVKLMNNDWVKGLEHINTAMERDKVFLSKSDEAFLYLKRGLAQSHLKNHQDSLDDYKKSFDLYVELGNKKQQGQLHTNMADAYGLLPSSTENYLLQQQHIQDAIDIFNTIESPILMIDAKMLLADIYKKNDKISEAIVLFNEIIVNARDIDDKIGEMIAINNLASTHLILNEYDKAIALGEQGLQMTLTIGNGIYIASSYSFLSELYQHEYKSQKAMEMMAQAIKYQLASNEFARLSPKVITLNYLLVQTYQYEKADELLAITQEYTQQTNSNKGVSVLHLYKGLNSARQNNWSDAEISLTKALEISQTINYAFKQPLNIAYLALAHFFNDNYLQTIQPAITVMDDPKSNKEARAIAALALAYTYRLMENNALADEWFDKTERLLNSNALFEYKLFLLLKLERQKQQKSILVTQTEEQIQAIEDKMQDLTVQAQVDPVIFKNLKAQLTQKIEEKKAE